MNFHTDYPADDMDDAKAYAALKRKQIEKENNIKLSEPEVVVEDGRAKFTWSLVE